MITFLLFIGLTVLFTGIGVLSVFIDWLVVFAIKELGMKDQFLEVLLFLIMGLLGPCWAGYATHIFMKKKWPQHIDKIIWPAIVGYGLVMIAVGVVYGFGTFFGLVYRGVRM